MAKSTEAKKPNGQAGAPAAQEAAQPARLDVPGAPQAQAAQPAQAARLDVPGAPGRNYRPETRTEAQAAAHMGPDAFPYPTPAPMHGLRGFTTLAGWAAQQLTGGEQPPETIIGDQKDALLILISNCKWLATCRVIQNATVAEHDEYGKFFLRAVERPGGGILIGVIDALGCCYGAPEWYEDLPNAAEAWRDWIAVCQQ